MNLFTCSFPFIHFPSVRTGKTVQEGFFQSKVEGPFDSQTASRVSTQGHSGPGTMAAFHEEQGEDKSSKQIRAAAGLARRSKAGLQNTYQVDISCRYKTPSLFLPSLAGIVRIAPLILKFTLLPFSRVKCVSHKTYKSLPRLNLFHCSKLPTGIKCKQDGGLATCSTPLLRIRRCHALFPVVSCPGTAMHWKQCSHPTPGSCHAPATSPHVVAAPLSTAGAPPIVKLMTTLIFCFTLFLACTDYELFHCRDPGPSHLNVQYWTHYLKHRPNKICWI